jgi:para-aminobenzoate synthetase/4-amino-4-deoxychorismate lyase
MTEEKMPRWKSLPTEVHALVEESPHAILLQTSRFDAFNRHSYLFLEPVSVISAQELDEVQPAFLQIEAALASGLHVAGLVSYECGYHFESTLNRLYEKGNFPLLWFGVYRKPYIFDHAEGRFDTPLPLPERAAGGDSGISLKEIALEISCADYCAKVEEIKEYIAAGDTYQVNLTDAITFAAPASIARAFSSLTREQQVAYSALLNLEDRQILSLSPELFFKIDGNRIVTRPMKGTMPRGLDDAEDSHAAARLQNDAKNRSEHVMIVDLLRNDLGRICNMGSVTVEDIFTTERYETLLQMTSTISGILKPSTSFYEIFRTMFPCGSVTGAPKVRTMELIQKMEQRPRGVYTGAIGYMSPDGNSTFNVAIRTMVVKDGMARMGVGSAIVADSQPEEEHRECLLKASFLARNRPAFQLMETLLWSREFSRLGMHLERLRASASYFGFDFDQRAIFEQLQERANTFQPERKYRVRVLLDRDGTTIIESREFVEEFGDGTVRIASERTLSTDVFRRHKTTQRELYNRQYAQARADGLDEIIFLNERNEVTEGAISNIFIEKSGRLFTPPVSCGVLPGIYRRHVLQVNSAAEEKVLTLEDIEAADAVFLCNSLRGLRRVKVLCRPSSK